MELLESQDPLKKKLVESSERHKRELEKDIKEIAERTERTMKNALIIGGALALTYLVVNQISSSRKKRKNKKVKVPKLEIVKAADLEPGTGEEETAGVAAPNLISQIGTQIMSQATAILLELAREKLMEFLQSRLSKEEPSEQ